MRSRGPSGGRLTLEWLLLVVLLVVGMIGSLEPARRALFGGARHSATWLADHAPRQ